MQSNEPIPPNVFSIGITKDSYSTESSQSSKQLTLNNLVGGTSTLLDYKFGAKTSDTSQIDQKVINQMKYLNNEQENNDLNDLNIVDITKDRKDLETEFDQVIFLFFLFNLNF